MKNAIVPERRPRSVRVGAYSPQLLGKKSRERLATTITKRFEDLQAKIALVGALAWAPAVPGAAAAASGTLSCA